jgi:hypothetical protein
MPTNTRVVTTSDLKKSLTDIRHAAVELYRFTEKLSLLKIIHQVAVQIIKSVDSIQKEIQTLPNNDFFDTLESSRSVQFLEEIADNDTMSELEEHILFFAKKLDDKELTLFLSEVIDKVESKYNVVLNKTHEFNELFNK